MKDRTREASANRKERRYNFSLEAALYEDVKFYAADGSPDQRIIQFEQYEEILKFIEKDANLPKNMKLAGWQVGRQQKNQHSSQ